MHRRDLLKLLPGIIPLLSGCAYTRIDPWHFLVRSDVIQSPEHEAEIRSRARLFRTDDGRIRVLVTKGTPYERGYQHGAILRAEVQDNLNYMYESAIDKFRSAELFTEAYERARPFIPQEYVDEMHGLAHGARMPIEVIHAIHILPSITEWGGKKRLKAIIKEMMAGELGTSCSNFSVAGPASLDGNLYSVRILDWGLHSISKLHEYPLLTVSIPEKGHASVNVGWVGFLGAISGMNSQGITLGEMGYDDPPNETLRGRPMPFLLRDVLSYSRNLSEVRKIVTESPGDNSFIFLMSDGKSGESEMYIKDHDRTEVHRSGVDFKDRDRDAPGIQNILYGGHYLEKMSALLNEHRGQIEPQMIMSKLIPEMAMKSNFQDVVYDPARLQLWVSYSSGPGNRAAEQSYTRFDLGETLRKHR